MKKFLLFISITSFLFFSCEKKVEPEKPKVLYQLKEGNPIPDFSSESAYNYVEAQVKFGPRSPNSTAHKEAKKYFEVELRKYCDELIMQHFTYTGYDNEKLELTNFIAKFNPSAKNRIVLCAHWDSRPRAERDKDESKRNLPIIGANDGGSGCGVLLEIASVLKNKKLNYGVDIVLFDGEDYGKESDLNNFCLGSKYFTATLPADYKPLFGILLDLVGDKEAVFYKEQYSVKYAGDIVSLVWGVAKKIGANQFSDLHGNAVYDDHVPMNQAAIRTIDIIDMDLVGGDDANERRNYWHSHRDDMSNISKETLQQVGDVLINLLYSLEFASN